MSAAIINTNTAATMASLNLDNNTNNLNKDINELSTGLSINSPADNPAGYVMAENMGSQIAGLNQATANTNDAANMIETAEAALGQVQDLITSMSSLAVQASNTGVYDTTDLQADQAQIQSAISSINNIAATTQFGTKYLLDGSNSTAGAYTAGSASLGGTTTGVSVIDDGRWGTQAGALGAITTAADMAVSTPATSTQYQIAGTGFNTGDDFTTGTATFNGTISINGTDYTVSPNSTLAELNSDIAGSGFTAAADATTTTDLDFTATTPGSSVAVPTINFSGLSVTDTSTATPPVAATVSLANSAAGTTLGTDPVLTIGSGATAINSTGAYYSTANSGFDYVFSNGLQVFVADSVQSGGKDANENGGTIAPTMTSVAGTQTVVGNGPLEFQIGANVGQTASQSISSVAADQLGWNTPAYTNSDGVTQAVGTDSVADINVTTFQGAQDAIAVLGNAQNQISTLAAQLGAFQTNVLQSNAQSLSVASENLQSAQGTVQDADMATTVVNYTTNDILVQAATSALSYANQVPQNLLKLLQ